MLSWMPSPAASGAGTVALATVAGAWLARWSPGRPRLWFAAAAGALLVIAAFHLLPDAWHDAREAGLSPWAVPAVAVGAFLGSAAIAGFGCACDADREHAGGAAGAAALSGHRFLEGSALALIGSPVVVVALAVHALGEGLAVGALLSGRSRARLAFWLGLMCVGPFAGVAVTRIYHLPAAVGPLLVAFAAGIIVQAARVSLRAALGRLRLREFLLSASAAAVVTAGVVTALAVHLAG